MSIVISLCQPFASLLIEGIKQYETRGWKPGSRNMKLLESQPLLIHASQSTKYAHLMGQQPFASYLKELGRMNYGAIIGECRIGKIWTSEDWVKHFLDHKIQRDYNWHDEYLMGDYSPKRFAWQILDPIKFDKPIPVKGKLSIWSWDPPSPSYSRIISPPELMP